MGKLVIGLSSGSIDKLLGAGIIMSGAAADDMEIEVYVLLTAARAFVKGNESLEEDVVEYPQQREYMLERLKELKQPGWVETFEQAKEYTDVKIYICSLAAKLWGAEKKEDFIDMVDGVCGIFQYIDAAKSAELHVSI